MTRRDLICGAASAAALRPVAFAADEWISLFDGTSLKGWQPNESPGTWSVKDGCLVCAGPRSHLFYTGGEFRNFELEAEIRTEPGANSGIHFHTAMQPQGWLARGFEAQINNTHLGEGNYRERKKTGSLYGVRNVYPQLVKDREWFRMNILVRGKNIQIRVNGVLVVNYTEAPVPLVAAGDGRLRVIGAGGSLALQGHDKGSQAAFRNLRVRRLPDDATAPDASAAQTDELAQKLLNLAANNYPVVDYHVHLKLGLTLEEALKRSQETGVGYGIAVNCGKGFQVENEEGARAFAESLRGAPAYAAMQGEGREWVDMFPRRAAEQFDYVFTDSMTWSDNRGKRMRLWMPNEVGVISDAEEFMETFVSRTVGILEREPIDIYVNPTFLPPPLDKDYDKLWTDERIKKVVKALKASDVALELNDRYLLPGIRVVQAAKAEGVKFTFGTNNAGPKDLRRSDYGVEMVEKCKLASTDFFTPKPRGERAIDRKGAVMKA